MSSRRHAASESACGNSSARFLVQPSTMSSKPRVHARGKRVRAHSADECRMLRTRFTFQARSTSSSTDCGPPRGGRRRESKPRAPRAETARSRRQCARFGSLTCAGRIDAGKLGEDQRHQRMLRQPGDNLPRRIRKQRDPMLLRFMQRAAAGRRARGPCRRR